MSPPFKDLYVEYWTKIKDQRPTPISIPDDLRPHLPHEPQSGVQCAAHRRDARAAGLIFDFFIPLSFN